MSNLEVSQPTRKSVAPGATAVLAWALLLALPLAARAGGEPAPLLDAAPPVQEALPPPPVLQEDAGFTLEEDYDPGAEFSERDPLEKMNRAIFLMNRGIEWAFLDPLSRFYGFVVPDPAQRAVLRFFDNLNTPGVLVNDLLQLDGSYAGLALARILVNSTMGVAGIYDPASALGMPGHRSDFGQTLASYGLGGGPYLVLPLFGPSTLRDALGRVVDAALRPQTYLLGPGERILLDAGDGIALRESHREDLEALRRSSVDYYAALRSAYLMSREAELRARAHAELAAPAPVGAAPREPVLQVPPMGSEGDAGTPHDAALPRRAALAR